MKKHLGFLLVVLSASQNLMADSPLQSAGAPSQITSWEHSFNGYAPRKKDSIKKNATSLMSFCDSEEKCKSIAEQAKVREQEVLNGENQCRWAGSPTPSLGIAKDIHGDDLELTYDQAEQYCQSQGGHIPSVREAVELMMAKGGAIISEPNTFEKNYGFAAFKYKFFEDGFVDYKAEYGFDRIYEVGQVFNPDGTREQMWVAHQYLKADLTKNNELHIWTTGKNEDHRRLVYRESVVKDSSLGPNALYFDLSAKDFLRKEKKVSTLCLAGAKPKALKYDAYTANEGPCLCTNPQDCRAVVTTATALYQVFAGRAGNGPTLSAVPLNNGRAVKMNQAEAIQYCKSQGLALPTAREFAFYGAANGARGVASHFGHSISVGIRYPRITVMGKNDGVWDWFSYDYHEYNPGPEDNRRQFWTATIATDKNGTAKGETAYIFSGSSGTFSAFNQNHRAEVRCINRL